MKNYLKIGLILCGILTTSLAYSQDMNMPSQNFQGNTYANENVGGGDSSCDQPCGDCYCLYCHWEPCYYNDWRCCEEPRYSKRKCCRYVPKYYEVQRCRYVPQYYCETCCKYEAEEYCVDECKMCKKWVCDKKCKYVPRYYYKHVCNPNAQAPVAPAASCCPAPQAPACCR